MINNLSKYVYGTTRLGHDDVNPTQKLEVGKDAISSGVWFHSSHQYNCFDALSQVLDADRSKTPNFIFKIGWGTGEQIRETIKANLEPVGLKKMQIGQLCTGDNLLEALERDPDIIDDLLAIRAEGLVDHFVLEVWPWNSEGYLQALKAGKLDGIIDAFIFYLNPLQRFVSNDLWDEIQARKFPVISMRTVTGGAPYTLAKGEGWAPEYLQGRVKQVIPVFERSGAKTWTEFCVRFIFGFDNVISTVGSSSKVSHLEAFLAETANPLPLPADIQAEVVALQREWFVQHDKDAAAWSM